MTIGLDCHFPIFGNNNPPQGLGSRGDAASKWVDVYQLGEKLEQMVFTKDCAMISDAAILFSFIKNACQMGKRSKR